MTRLRGHGATPATSTQTVLLTPRRCCLTARSWSREALAALHLQLVARNLTARSFSIRPPRLGASSVVSTNSEAVPARRRCLPMVRSWSREMRLQSYTTQAPGRGVLLVAPTVLHAAAVIPRPYYAMARSWWREASAGSEKSAAAVLTGLRSMTQPQGHGAIL